MALARVNPRKPVIFGRKKVEKQPGTEGQAASKGEDQTLDMLLHYAKAGIEEAERSIRQTPELFTPEEQKAFLQNKNMLENAPFLIENYKSKAAEHDALLYKMKGILKKCEEIVAAGDQEAKEDIKQVLQETQVFTYNDEGDLVLKRDAS